MSEMDRFVSARLLLIRMYVFFGSLAMSLDLVEDETLEFAAATDGKVIKFNPNMTKGWSVAELAGVLVHETLHVILLHHLRRGSRQPRKWNIACDYVVNAEIVSQFPRTSSLTPILPKGCLLDTKFNGMNAEQVYNLLPDQNEDDQHNGQGQGQFDWVEDGAQGMSESEVRAAEAQVKARIQNAAALARKAGQMSGGLERLIEAVCEPKASWRDLIRDYLTEKAEIDFNWAKPHQRMLSQLGVIYPTLDGEKIGKLVMIIDASGSCFNDQEQFCSEVSDILSAYEVSLTVIFHDTKVTHVDEYGSDDLPIQLRPKGFGGTDCKEAYELAIELDPDLIIHLTDLELSWRGVTVPHCDTVIACSEKRYFDACPDWARLIDIS